ncbi:MAG: helix-turn-helix transcriptional regulator [Archangium sp.]|nr:helix-turn-helix transcriptional regulator [Archangium sp.]
MAALDEEQVLRNLGRRIAEIRVASGLTQDAMAERLEISTKYLQRLERGRSMTLSTLIRLANLLDASLEELLLTKAASTAVQIGRPRRVVAKRRKSR